MRTLTNVQHDTSSLFINCPASATNHGWLDNWRTDGKRLETL